MSALGFGGESSSDEQEETVEQWRKSVQKRSRKQHVNVVDESIYQYDEHYDESQDVKKRLKKPKVEGPKFMKNLLIAKERRKQDKGRVEDVRAARERELEGDEYKDKEVFVTEGYKQYKAAEQGQETEAMKVSLGIRKAGEKVLVAEKLTEPGVEPEVKPVISKSRLLPRLDEAVILDYRQRYLQRCVK